MNCLRCGRETGSEQVFCSDCQLEMDKYPVKPGTLVMLPRRQEAAVPKKSGKRRNLPLEEQVKLLRRRVRIQILLLIITLLIIAAMIYPTVEYLREDHFLPGQNYTSFITTTPPADNS